MKTTAALVVLFLSICRTGASQVEETPLNNYLTKVKDQHTGLTGIKRKDKWVLRPSNVTVWTGNKTVVVSTAHHRTGLLSEKGDWILDTAYVSFNTVSRKKKDFGFVVYEKDGFTALFNPKGEIMLPFRRCELTFTDDYILSNGDSSCVYDYNLKELIPLGEYSISCQMHTFAIEQYDREKQTARVYHYSRKEKSPEGFERWGIYGHVSKAEITLLDYLAYLGSRFSVNQYLDDSTALAILPDTTGFKDAQWKLWNKFIHVVRTVDSENYPVLKQLTPTIQEVSFPFELSSNEQQAGNVPLGRFVNDSEKEHFTGWLNYQLSDLSNAGYKIDLVTTHPPDCYRILLWR